MSGSQTDQVSLVYLCFQEREVGLIVRHPVVESETLQETQKEVHAETNPMFIIRQTDKQDMAYPYNGILFDLQKE